MNLPSLVCTVAEGNRVSHAENSREKSIGRAGKELRARKGEHIRINVELELAPVFVIFNF